MTVIIPGTRTLEAQYDGPIPADAYRLAAGCERHGIPVDVPVPDEVAMSARAGFWDLARTQLLATRLADTRRRREDSLLGRVASDLDAALGRALGADADRAGMFSLHRCWRCQDGAEACREGNPRTCGYPVARNH